jgi:hypothetical protein
LKGLVDVARPLLRDDLRRRSLWQLVESVATALPESPVIQRDDVDTRRGKLLGKAIPDLALPIALMQ